MSLVDYDDGSRVITDVMICDQGDTGTCAQACITSLLNYWGITADYNAIIAETNPTMNAGMTPDQIVWYLRNNGLQARAYKGTLSILRSLIDRGLPTMVIFDEFDTFHVVLVVGYNDEKEVIYYNDSEGAQMMEETYSSFVRSWGKQRLGAFGAENYSNMIIEVKR